MNAAESARAIIDANAYMTLATADEAGTPWASPVWFAHDDWSEFVWVSRPGARHSRNIAVRHEIGLVIFDSTVPVGSAAAVYIEAIAEAIEPVDIETVDIERRIATFSRRLQAQGEAPWTADDVRGDAQFRLYLARATTHYLLDDHDQRVEVLLQR